MYGGCLLLHLLLLGQLAQGRVPLVISPHLAPLRTSARLAAVLRLKGDLIDQLLGNARGRVVSMVAHAYDRVHTREVASEDRA